MPSMGRGVIATQCYYPGDLIETCPVIAIPAEQCDALYQTELYNYAFQWRHDAVAIALGMGSLYNHSYSPNAVYQSLPDDGVIRITALKPIQPGDQIFINYNKDPNDMSPLWFEAS
ncbi:SET domain-containing protein-lysine N-methyltransferase [Candidatus Sumerlaeota bacterium]|nr:SET domain-containing protein-lysine N-methyltransferase [Candidatus Sumerlaeota bacterium]